MINLKFFLEKAYRYCNKTAVRWSPLVLLSPTRIDAKTVAVGENDGRWLIPSDLFPENSICYCVGVGVDCSFDIELAARFQANVFSFDPTPSSVEYMQSVSHPRLKFLPWGVWKHDGNIEIFPQQRNSITNLSVTPSGSQEIGTTVPCFRLKTIMEKLGHKHIDLLKIDIEGAWYEVLMDMVSCSIAPKILCVEFDSPTSIRRVREAVSLLRQNGLILVCREKEDYLFAREDLQINAK